MFQYYNLTSFASLKSKITNMEKIGLAGDYGRGVKSYCKVQFELLNDGGIDFELTSKVKFLYGNTIKKLVTDMMAFFDVKNAKVIINDRGTVDSVMAARIEAAIKKLLKLIKSIYFLL